MVYGARSCQSHQSSAPKACINCQAPLCGRCHRFDINGRAWCASCGSYKVPGAGAALAGLTKALGKFLGVVVPAVLTFFVLSYLVTRNGTPFMGVMFRVAATVGVAIVMAKIVYVRDSIGATRIEEYKNGSLVRTI